MEMFNRGFAMSNIVENESDLAKSHSAPLMQTSNARGFHIVLIGFVLIGVAALVASQLFGCSSCYS
jgi:predicted ABC-type ATPase